jgi:hypothetical protein
VIEATNFMGGPRSVRPPVTSSPSPHPRASTSRVSRRAPRDWDHCGRRGTGARRCIARRELEFLLTLLRYRRQEGLRPQIVLLSAVIGDANGLERWIAGRLLRSERRPVPLREGILRADGVFRYVDSDGTEKRVGSRSAIRGARVCSARSVCHDGNGVRLDRGLIEAASRLAVGPSWGESR